MLLGAGVALLLVLAFVPARADIASDLVRCQKSVQAKDADSGVNDATDCMRHAGYGVDRNRHVDELTTCGDADFPGQLLRCYGKPGLVETRPLPRPLVPGWRTAPIDTLIAVAEDWNDKCRGGQTTWSLTEDACNTRSRAIAILSARGWCWAVAPGKEDFEANKIWQDCRPVNANGR